MVSYGLNVGVYYALSTLLNQIIKPTFLDNPKEDAYEEDFLSTLDTKIGQMGTIMVSSFCSIFDEIFYFSGKFSF